MSNNHDKTRVCRSTHVQFPKRKKSFTREEEEDSYTTNCPFIHPRRTLNVNDRLECPTVTYRKKDWSRKKYV